MIVKTDVRRQYCKMLMNVLNTWDFPLLWSFFETFAHPGEVMMLKQPLYPPQMASALASSKAGLSPDMAEKLKPSRFRSPVPYAHGLGPHQPPASYEPLLPLTNMGLCFVGIPFITYYWASLLQMIPDQVVTFDDVQIITRAGKSDSYLLCRFSVVGQELYDLNFRELVEDLMQEMSTKTWMQTNPPIALSRALPSASLMSASKMMKNVMPSASLAVVADLGASVALSESPQMSVADVLCSDTADNVPSAQEVVLKTVSSTDTASVVSSISVSSSDDTLRVNTTVPAVVPNMMPPLPNKPSTSKILQALLREDASFSLPIPDPTLIPPDRSRPEAPSAYYDPIQSCSKKLGRQITIRPTPLLVQGLCYIHVDEDKRIRSIDFRLFGDGSLLMNGADPAASVPATI
jgi:hypothetical protein